MKNNVQGQDQAAGGRGYRDLRLEDGKVVTVSVSVRSYAKAPNGRYGYMQFKAYGKTVTKYIGSVTADSETASLQIGWRLMHKRKLAEAYGWTWVAKPRK